MRNIKEIIIGLLLLLLVIFSLVREVKINNLRSEINDLKSSNIELVDSLEWINHHYENEVTIHLNEVEILNQELDSLNAIKHRIIIQKDGVVVSSNISDGAELLKENISKWKN